MKLKFYFSRFYRSIKNKNNYIYFFYSLFVIIRIIIVVILFKKIINNESLQQVSMIIKDNWDGIFAGVLILCLLWLCMWKFNTKNVEILHIFMKKYSRYYKELFIIEKERIALVQMQMKTKLNQIKNSDLTPQQYKKKYKEFNKKYSVLTLRKNQTINKIAKLKSIRHKINKDCTKSFDIEYKKLVEQKVQLIKKYKRIIYDLKKQKKEEKLLQIRIKEGLEYLNKFKLRCTLVGRKIVFFDSLKILKNKITIQNKVKKKPNYKGLCKGLCNKTFSNKTTPETPEFSELVKERRNFHINILYDYLDKKNIKYLQKIQNFIVNLETLPAPIRDKINTIYDSYIDEFIYDHENFSLSTAIYFYKSNTKYLFNDVINGKFF